MSNNINSIIFDQNDLTEIKRTFKKLKDVCKTDIVQRKNKLSKDNLNASEWLIGKIYPLLSNVLKYIRQGEVKAE